ncbi:YitT family protein [bacterium]|nr:YitT family protein [bacterium]
MNKKASKAETYLMLLIGAFIEAVGLEMFLIPNNMVDGGTIGISIMVSYLTGINLGVLIMCVNSIFMFMALQMLGKEFVVRAIYATAMLGISVDYIHNHFSVATNDLLLTTVFGGICLGVGVGLILRNSAATDGTEIMAIRISRQTGFSVGEIIMFFNVFIYTAAAFLYGIERAMYSVLAYFIASRVIDMVVAGFNESKSLNIISDKARDIGDALMKNFEMGITYVKGTGGYSGKAKEIIFCVVSRIELAQVKQTIKSIDEKAFISVENVFEVEGTRISKEKKLFDTKRIMKVMKRKKSIKSSKEQNKK